MDNIDDTNIEKNANSTTQRNRKASFIWSDKSTFILIRMIKSNDNLWNRNSKYYRNRKIANNTWKSIASQLDIPVNEIILRWQSCRSNYIAYKRKKHKGLRPHPIYAKMKFLDAVVSNKSNETNVNSANTSVITPDFFTSSTHSVASESNAEIMTESNESDASDCFEPKVNDRILTLKKIRPPMQKTDNERSVPMDLMQSAYKTDNDRSVAMNLMQSAYKTLMENMQVDEHAMFANVIAQNLRTWSSENKPFALRYRAALSSLNAEFELEAAKNAIENDVQSRTATIKLECTESDLMLT